MDFVSLATATSARRLILRQAETTEDYGYDAEDGAAGSEYDVNGESSNAMLNETHSRPLLSPAAEAELFLLATNFLLYVAMVIIITMVAKIYFPESLKRGQNGAMARSYEYRMVEDGGAMDGAADGGDYLGSDDEEEEEDDDDANDVEIPAVQPSKSDEGQFVGTSTASTALPPTLPPVTAGGLEMEPTPPLTSKKQRRKRRLRKSKAKSSAGGTATAAEASFRRTPSRADSFLEFDQSTSDRATVLKRLAFCVLMLNVTFVTWGVLQERMLTRRYPRYTGDYFHFSYALVFTNRFWTLIMSGLLMLYLQPSRSQSTVIYEYSFPSISNMLSSWCQYEALKYVSFPAVTLFKSFKLAPVMAMGKVLGNKEYPWYDYFVALLIGTGIAMFMTSTDDFQVGFLTNIYDEKAFAKSTGIMLLGLYLGFDSFTSQWQSRMFQRHRDLSMMELMFATSAFSTLLSMITLIHTQELWPALDFVIAHSEIHLHFFFFSICSTVGQLFIFYTIKNFGAVVFTIIMTTRILLSIALSCVMYGHKVSSVSFLGLMMVIGAVCFRIKKKAEGKQLVKWQGMQDDKAMELVQEWHEHVDT